MVGKLTDKVALVTGAASGIGRSTAERLAGEGAYVFITDVQQAEGRQLAERIAAAGGQAEFVVLDVAREQDWVNALCHVQARGRSIDILVNNAGIALRAPLTEMPLADFRRQNAINIDGVFLGLKHVIPIMRRNGGGNIINMSSVSGLKGIPMMAGYSASKWAVRSLTKSSALECAADNIRINSIHPGMIDTPIYDNFVNAHGEQRSAAVADWATQVVPTKVKGTPEDIASAVLWLASDESRYVTGIELVIDGGMVLQ